MKYTLLCLLLLSCAGCFRDRSGDDEHPPTPLSREEQVQMAVFEHLIAHFDQKLYFLAVDDKKPRDPSPEVAKRLRKANKRVRLHSEGTLKERAEETATGKRGAIVIATIQRWQNDTAFVRGECMPGPLSGGSFLGRVVRENDRWVVHADSEQVLGKSGNR
jgi:hypothetical protein